MLSSHVHFTSFWVLLIALLDTGANRARVFAASCIALVYVETTQALCAVPKSACLARADKPGDGPGRQGSHLHADRPRQHCQERALAAASSGRCSTGATTTSLLHDIVSSVELKALMGEKQ